MSSRITVHSGRMVDPLNFQDDDVRVDDICWALSLQCRFSGHVEDHYSVGQHSVICSDMVDGNDQTRFDALMHDASEAYLQDVARPLKEDVYFGQAYRGAEARVQRTISQVLGLTWPIPVAVKETDMRMCVTERRDLMPFHVPGSWDPDWEALAPYDIVIKAWTPRRTRREFMLRFDRLRRDR